MNVLFNSRFLFFIIFLCCAGSLATAFFLEYVMDMIPCVLCWVQRAMFAFTGLICLVACIHNPQCWGRRVYAFLAAIFSILGIVAAARQIWLKYNPGFSCLSSDIEEIFARNPFFEAVYKAFQGTPECGLLADKFLGIPLPYWGVATFSFFSLVLLFQLVRPNPKPVTAQ